MVSDEFQVLENVPQAELTSADNNSSVSQALPWYMEGGQVWPHHCPGEREEALFPEEAPGDRMISQLMFLPPVVSPPDTHQADLPLKKILFWNGASSWGVKPGPGVFLKVVGYYRLLLQTKY